MASLTIRRANERGHANHGWLDSWHSFSFADYYDPDFMGFRGLRVINEDRVAPANGFGTHGHQDMEIVTYILEGDLSHKDSLGNGSTIRPGDVQRMSAGTGVMHSEINPSPDKEVHLLQIWIEPLKYHIAPSYEEKRFDRKESLNQLRLIASPDGKDGSVTINADARIFSAILEKDAQASHENIAGRNIWIQIARGTATINGETLRAGDGASTGAPGSLNITATEPSELLIFDLA